MIKFGRRSLTPARLLVLERRCGNNYLKALQRDEFRCILCDWKDYVVVHHIDRDIKNNKLNNLATVCMRCHAGLHGLTLCVRSPKREIILELRKEGFTYQEIGNNLGISRQRVYQILRCGNNTRQLCLQNLGNSKTDMV